MNDNRKVLIRYLITTVVAGLFALLIMYLHGFWETAELVNKYKILADAFTIPGILLIMITALVWISTDGFFDMLSYAMRRFGNALIFRQSEYKSFYDYKVSRAEKRAHGYSFLFFVGLGFMVIAAVFMCLFYSLYK